MEQTGNVADRSVLVTRILYAPPETVWMAWTQAEHIASWWGPKGFSNTIHQMDVAADGEWRLTMHGPDGKNYPNKSRFLEILPMEKIVFRHYNPNYIATILFGPVAEGTWMSWTVEFETAKLYDTVVKVFKANKGLYENVEKLEHYLRNLAIQ